MSIISTATDLANIAGSRLGGFGNQANGAQTLTDLAGTDAITTWVNLFLPQARQRVIKDLARAGLPFRETFKFADLGDDLKQDDVSIASMTLNGAAATVVTQDAHGYSTGDKRFLADLQGTSGVTALNGTTVTVTVTDTTTFTFVSTATGTHTANTGIVSKCPEIGSWIYAFNLPADCLEVVGQFDEYMVNTLNNYQTKYQFATILNAAGDGYLLLTNYISNVGGDSAYIGYVTDSTAYSMWPAQMVDAVASALAVMLCPVVAMNVETQKQLELFYRYEAIPYCKACNAAMFSDKPIVNIDYTGGRAGSLQPKLRNNLGTFVDGAGNRRDVY